MHIDISLWDDLKNAGLIQKLWICMNVDISLRGRYVVQVVAV